MASRKALGQQHFWLPKGKRNLLLSSPILLKNWVGFLLMWRCSLWLKARWGLDLNRKPMASQEKKNKQEKCQPKENIVTNIASHNFFSPSFLENWPYSEFSTLLIFAIISVPSMLTFMEIICNLKTKWLQVIIFDALTREETVGCIFITVKLTKLSLEVRSVWLSNKQLGADWLKLASNEKNHRSWYTSAKPAHPKVIHTSKPERTFARESRPPATHN